MWSMNVVFGMLVMLLVHHRASGQQEYGSCRNPHSQEGRCVNIRACEPLLDLLRKYGNQVGDFLRQSVCVYEDGDPIVCCPNVPNKGEYNDNNNNNNNNNNNGNNNNNNNHNVANNNRNNNPFLPAQPGANSYGPLLSPVCGYTNASYTRVVNGVPAELGFWPWAALLGYRSQKNPRKPRYLCGGSLISSRHVLTAGHCVYGRNDLYMVRLGELDIENDNDGATPIDLPIERKTIHPQYSPNMYTNDIAVLRLAQPIQQFTHLLKPICLPVTREIQQTDLNDLFPYIVGWGALNFNGPSASVLQQLQVPVVKEGQCRAAYRGKGATIDNRVLCAGYAEGGKDACQGDSGGPLMVPIEKTWYSIGVVSYGFKCAVPGFPGVYTKTQVFLDFILSALN